MTRITGSDEPQRSVVSPGSLVTLYRPYDNHVRRDGMRATAVGLVVVVIVGLFVSDAVVWCWVPYNSKNTNVKRVFQRSNRRPEPNQHPRRRHQPQPQQQRLGNEDTDGETNDRTARSLQPLGRSRVKASTTVAPSKRAQKTTRAATATPPPSQSSPPPTKRNWNDRLAQLQSFYSRHGHSRVGASHEATFPGLYQWTRTLRSRYRHQIVDTTDTPGPTTLQPPHDDIDDVPATRSNFISSSLPRPRGPGRRNDLVASQLQALDALEFDWHVVGTRFHQHHHHQHHNHSVPSKSISVSSVSWRHQYGQLQRFYAAQGHCRVPMTLAVQTEYPGLGVWVRNQRRDCKAARQLEGATTSTSRSNSTTGSTFSNRRVRNEEERWALLQQLDFEWYQSHETAWMTRYQQLVRYQHIHGHCHVPQDKSSTKVEDGAVTSATDKGDDDDDNDNFTGLGQWCMNQRTAYKRYRQNLPTALTQQRMELLLELGFSWNVKEHAWQCMLQRLRDYGTSTAILLQPQSQHSLNSNHSDSDMDANSEAAPTTGTAAASDGYFSIPLADTANRDLRLWLVWLRYCYHNNQRNATQAAVEQQSSLPRLSEARIQAVEAAIPGFCWSPRNRKADGSPSTEDWSKLFDAMRDKGIGPNVRPKQHWFEGMNPQSVQVKDVWTEQELLALWNQENDETDEEDDYVDLRDRRDRGYN